MTKPNFLKGGICKHCHHEIWLFKDRPWTHTDGDLAACSNPEPKERPALREAPRPVRQRGTDQLYAALAFAVTTGTIGGFVAWLAWQIHTIAGWFG